MGKRLHHLFCQAARAAMCQAGVPYVFWPFAVVMSAKNMSMVRLNEVEQITPYEALRGKAPPTPIPFGCRVIRLEVRDGFIRKIDGGLDAKLMHNWLEDNRDDPDDMDGHAISHLGWGLNPQCRWDNVALYGDDPDRSNGTMRAFAGNFLFSTGPNSQGGGKRTTTGHYDVPMRDCSIMLDNELIIDKGRFTEPEMVVTREHR